MMHQQAGLDLFDVMCSVASPAFLCQVVDGNWGMGVSIPKYVFEKSGTRYKSRVVCGSSTPV
jgi:hypothetical protein